MKSLWRCWIPALLIGGCMIQAQSPPAVPAEPVFRSETRLALLSFEYIPANGRLVEELRAEDIQIREDGVPQKMALFEGGRFHPRAVPIEFILLFDVSGSVRFAGEMNPELFNDGLLNEFPHASIGVYAFSDDLVRIVRPTRNAALLKKAVDTIWAVRTGNTALFQQISNTLRDVAAVPSRALRMLVVVSDGMEWPPSGANLVPGVTRLANDLGIPINTVLLPQRSPAAAPAPVERPKSRLPSWRDNEQMLSVESISRFTGLAPATGGTSVSVLGSESLLPTLLAKMARHARYLYVTGYYPTNPDGRRHKTEVVLTSKSLGRIERGERTILH